MARYYLIKSEYGLMPSDEKSEKALRKFGFGEYVRCDIKSNRNISHHAKWFAIFNKTFENQEAFETESSFRDYLKIKVGWYTEYVTPKGQLVYSPKSMDFETMEQEDFDGFYNDTIDIMEEIVPGVSSQR